MPKNGSWNGFTGNTWTQYAITGGASWSSSWWPASGYRESSNARLYAIGNWTGYWSSSRHTSTAYYAYGLYFDYTGSVGPSGNSNRSNGFPIRCIEEKKNEKI